MLAVDVVYTCIAQVRDTLHLLFMHLSLSARCVSCCMLPEGIILEMCVSQSNDLDAVYGSILMRLHELVRGCGGGGGGECAGAVGVCVWGVVGAGV